MHLARALFFSGFTMFSSEKAFPGGTLDYIVTPLLTPAIAVFPASQTAQIQASYFSLCGEHRPFPSEKSPGSALISGCDMKRLVCKASLVWFSPKQSSTCSFIVSAWAATPLPTDKTDAGCLTLTLGKGSVSSPTDEN